MARLQEALTQTFILALNLTMIVILNTPTLAHKPVLSTGHSMRVVLVGGGICYNTLHRLFSGAWWGKPFSRYAGLGCTPEDLPAYRLLVFAEVSRHWCGAVISYKRVLEEDEEPPASPVPSNTQDDMR